MRRVAPALALSVALAVSACGITSGPDQDPSPTAASGAPTWQPHTPSPQRTAASCRTVVVAAGDIVDDVEIADQTGRIAAAQEPDQVLLLGDNQYPSGALKAYQEEYDHTSWGRLKAITNPVPGNHEYRTRGAAGYFAYFNQPPPYYAYDAGCGWRAYALNSEIAVEPQVSWLRRDLAAHPDAAVLAYWHRPRWSSGTEHGSELDVQPFWTALAGRTGMVLNGHEHNYERFAPVGRIREFVAGTGGSTTYRFRRPRPGQPVAPRPHSGRAAPRPAAGCRVPLGVPGRRRRHPGPRRRVTIRVAPDGCGIVCGHSERGVRPVIWPRSAVG